MNIKYILVILIVLFSTTFAQLKSKPEHILPNRYVSINETEIFNFVFAVNYMDLYNIINERNPVGICNDIIIESHRLDSNGMVFYSLMAQFNKHTNNQGNIASFIITEKSIKSVIVNLKQYEMVLHSIIEVLQLSQQTGLTFIEI
ncbi:hypothetical protein DICPUDRAFT_79556 [Dictyostelium purpureum]|uniref:Uncharacterized protein n=1 Tax=Dictyostelium purpureum TaxID=5786 RepID=F0ZMY3_DICPU|nr:uncharacterized protein DICPUDRAFT_79556 [Dictyostelium purpureum]EGC34689.1 hypothetical protein DICPUDRAFT_79556 [Dictyostelium purpureum]|eukprot:XP_003288774.1 hypothetical protein DICPUDRAFT_79556 [Dictyostelium purpureum]